MVRSTFKTSYQNFPWDFEKIIGILTLIVHRKRQIFFILKCVSTSRLLLLLILFHKYYFQLFESVNSNKVYQTMLQIFWRGTSMNTYLITIRLIAVRYAESAPVAMSNFQRISLLSPKTCEFRCLSVIMSIISNSHFTT